MRSFCGFACAGIGGYNAMEVVPADALATRIRADGSLVVSRRVGLVGGRPGSDRAMQYVEDHFAEQAKTRYTLSDECLSIARRGARVDVPLKGLNPNYEIARLRSPAFYVGLVGCIVASIALLVGLIGELGLLDAESSLDAFAFAIIAGVISLFCLIPSWRKVERAYFESTMMGVDDIMIARAGPDEDNFYGFVDELAQRIRSAKESADS